jgi:hypothetical protein
MLFAEKQSLLVKNLFLLPVETGVSEDFGGLGVAARSRSVGV